MEEWWMLNAIFSKQEFKALQTAADPCWHEESMLERQRGLFQELIYLKPETLPRKKAAD